MKHVCVFCGGNPGSRPEYGQAARAFGTALAARGLGLVFGGSNKGLMGAVASGALNGGGHVIGVLPRVLTATETPFPELADLRLVDSMAERKALMLALSDACVALPGGYGTLDELFETITLSQLGVHALPGWLLNVCGYFDALEAFLDHASREGLLQPQHRALLPMVTNPEALADLLADTLR
ncbi:MAG: TIGR00730 family Rossman fold protein [Thermoflexales bacterium]